MTRTRLLAQGSTVVVTLAVIGLLPAAMPNEFYLYTAVVAVTYLVAALGLNLLVGFTGLISIGTAAFFLAGAYTAALLQFHYGTPYWVGALAAVVVTAVVGVVTGFPALKLGGFAIAVVTLAYTGVFVSLIFTFDEATGGGTGLVVPSSDLPLSQLWWIFASIAALIYLGSRNLIQSPLGRAWTVGRISEPLAGSLGIHTGRLKLSAFTIAAATAGLAGATYPILNGPTTTEPFNLDLSVLILLMVVLGGQATVWGPALGVGVLTAIRFSLDQVFSEGGDYATLIYGGILLLTVVAIPRGLVGLIDRVAVGVRRARAAASLSIADSGSRPPTPAQQQESAGSGGRSIAIPRRSPGRPATQAPALIVHEVSKSLGGVLAVHDMSLRVEPGTVHGLIGPNGAGKTTLLNCATGLLRADAGRISLGETVLRGGAARFARAGIGRTFQTSLLVEDATATENVLVGVDAARHASYLGYLVRTPGARAEAQAGRDSARHLLDTLGLGDVADRPVRELPPGRRRLVEIARALATAPSIVVMDEPAAGLPGSESQELEGVIRALRDAGVAVLLVEHHTDLVMRLCDTVSVMDAGELVTSGGPTHVQADPRVIAAYLGGPTPVAGGGGDPT